MINKTLASAVLTVLLSFFSLFSAHAFSAENTFNIEDGIALQGYDAVAYFSERETKGAMKGSEEYSAQHNNATYYFINSENRDRFMQHPESFLPEYGGWCAYAMLEGDIVNIDPESFKIVEGKLFLFYDGFWGDTLKKWDDLIEEQPESELITIADRHWNELSK